MLGLSGARYSDHPVKCCNYAADEICRKKLVSRKDRLDPGSSRARNDPQKLLLSLASDLDGFGGRDTHETDLLLRNQTSDPRQVSRDHRANLWIAAGGLPVIQQDDWLTARRHLDHAVYCAIRGNVGGTAVLKTRSVKPNADPVGCCRNSEALAIENLKGVVREVIILRTWNDADGTFLVLRR